MRTPFLMNHRLNPAKVEFVVFLTFILLICGSVSAFSFLYFRLETKMQGITLATYQLAEIEKVRVIQARRVNTLLAILSENASVTGIDRFRTVRTTGYEAKAEQCDATPTITASNGKTKAGRGVAVSRDLYQSGWTFGKKVWISGIGERTIDDLMHEKWKKRVDVLVASEGEAQRITGKRKVVLLD